VGEVGEPHAAERVERFADERHRVEIHRQSGRAVVRPESPERAHLGEIGLRLASLDAGEQRQIGPQTLHRSAPDPREPVIERLRETIHLAEQPFERLAGLPYGRPLAMVDIVPALKGRGSPNRSGEFLLRLRLQGAPRSVSSDIGSTGSDRQPGARRPLSRY
jgi:hypothetical protein